MPGHLECKSMTCFHVFFGPRSTQLCPHLSPLVILTIYSFLILLSIFFAYLRTCPFRIFFLGDLPLNLQPYRGDNQSEISCLRKPLPRLSLSTLSKFCRMFRPPKRILLELVKRMTGCVAQPPWIPTTPPENVNLVYFLSTVHFMTPQRMHGAASSATLQGIIQ